MKLGNCDVVCTDRGFFRGQILLYANTFIFFWLWQWKGFLPCNNEAWLFCKIFLSYNFKKLCILYIKLLFRPQLIRNSYMSKLFFSLIFLDIQVLSK